MAQFEYTYNGVTIYEGSTAFYLVHNGREVVLGDGVDMIFTEDGQSLPVGDTRFYDGLRAWVRSIDADELATLFGLGYYHI